MGSMVVFRYCREVMNDSPPPLSTSEPGSFAMKTIAERKPRIVEQVLETNRVDEEHRRALRGFIDEMRTGVVTSPLQAIPPGALIDDERRAWERQLSLFAGKSWLDIPWFFAEAFFYLKLLHAFGYWTGPGAGRDPFAALKEEELCGGNGGAERARGILRAVQGIPLETALPLLVDSCLWGNRVDLSNFAVDDGLRAELLTQDNSLLVVNHTAQAVEALRAAARIDILLDNAGPELVADLLLVDRLLTEGGLEHVTLHAKRLPFFVSDATRADVLHTVDVLSASGDPLTAAAGARLRGALDAGSVRLTDHWFWNSALHFTALPAECSRSLGSADLILVKGDANYRRILEDRRWESWRSLEELAGYFPGPFLCLRTLKSDVIVDVPTAKAEELDREDPEWRVNGKRGIVRFCGP
jgi:hypothetical protein